MQLEAFSVERKAIRRGQRVALGVKPVAQNRMPQRQHVNSQLVGPPSMGKEADACRQLRSEEHTSELQSQSTISYAVFCLKKKKQQHKNKKKKNKKTKTIVR